jgi:hypothetical protein
MRLRLCSASAYLLVSACMTPIANAFLHASSHLKQPIKTSSNDNSSIGSSLRVKSFPESTQTVVVLDGTPHPPLENPPNELFINVPFFLQSPEQMDNHPAPPNPQRHSSMAAQWLEQVEQSIVKTRADNQQQQKKQKPVFETMTVAELQKELKVRGLKTTGKKEVLVERINDHDAALQADGVKRVVHDVVGPLVRVELEKDVSQEAIKGVLVSTTVFMALASKSVAVSGTIGLGAAYTALTRGTAGEMARAIGQWFWSTFAAMIDIFQRLDPFEGVTMDWSFDSTAPWSVNGDSSDAGMRENEATNVAATAADIRHENERALRLAQKHDTFMRALMKRRFDQTAIDRAITLQTQACLAEAAKVVEEKTREEQARLVEEKKRMEEEASRLAAIETAILAERARIEDEKRIAAEQKAIEEAMLAEERKRLEEEASRLAAIETARVAEQARIEEEKRMVAKQMAIEEARLADERKRLEEEASRLAAIETARVAEQALIENEKRIAVEQKAIEEARLADERKRLEEEASRLEAIETARLAEQARIEVEKRIAVEQTALEEARLREERKRLEEEASRLAAIETARLAEQARVEDEKRIAAESRVREEARLAEQSRADAARKQAQELEATEKRIALDERLAQEAAEQAENLRLSRAAETRHTAEAMEGDIGFETSEAATSDQIYSSLSVAKLKEKLKDRGLSTAGKKDELIHRLLMDDNKGKTNSEFTSDFDDDFDDVDDLLGTDDLESLGKAVRDALQVFESSEASAKWNTLPLKDLKSELESRGLPAQGKKADLVAALEAATSGSNVNVNEDDDDLDLDFGSLDDEDDDEDDEFDLDFGSIENLAEMGRQAREAAEQFNAAVVVAANEDEPSDEALWEIEQNLPAMPSILSASSIKYNRMTVIELKDELRTRGLVVSGKKSDLVTRLEDSDNDAV